MSAVLNILKSVKKSYARVEDVLEYTLQISNDGDIPLDQVVVVDTLTGDLEFVLGSVMMHTQIMPTANIVSGIEIGRLGVGNKVTLTFKAKVVANNTPIINQATATYMYLVGDNQIERGSSLSNPATVTILNPFIQLQKTADKKFVTKGNQIVYTVTLANTGDLPALNVVFSDVLPEGVELVEGTFTINGQVVNQIEIRKGIFLGNMAVSSTVIIQYTAIIVDADCRGWIHNQAYVKFEYMFPDGTDGVITTKTGQEGSTVQTRLTPLMIDKTSRQKAAIVSDAIPYTLEVQNIGETPLNQVVVLDRLVEQLSFVPGSVKVDGQKWENASVITGIQLGTLLPQAYRIITFDAKIISNSKKTVYNEAEGLYTYVLGDGREQKDCTHSNQTTLAIYNPYVKVDKKADRTFAVLGDVITYTVDLTNEGDVKVANINFVDNISKEQTLIPGSFKINGQAVNEVQLDKGIYIGDLDVRESMLVTYQTEVINSNCAGWIKNKARVSFDYTLVDGQLGQITSTDEEEGAEVMIEVGMSNFKQFSIEYYLGIPSQKPHIETINGMTGSIDINHSHVIETTASISVEGQKLTGHKLIIRGSLQLVIEYTALEETQSVHSAHYAIPFGTFIILPTSYTPASRIQIEGVVEDIYYKCTDIRNFFTNTSVLINAKIAGC